MISIIIYLANVKLLKEVQQADQYQILAVFGQIANADTQKQV
jgi:hypothetical protein